MHPDNLIYDEINRHKRPWEPLPLHLPLYEPHRHQPDDNEEEDEESTSLDRGVTIIDMNDYTEVDW
ncbi:MAG: hypothetical protein AAFX99_21950 [Myxococcota bacterium]